MSNLLVNPALVLPVIDPTVGQLTRLVTGFCDTPLTAGQPVWVSIFTGKFSLTNSADPNACMVFGIAMNSTTAAFQGVTVAVGGDIMFGTNAVVGDVVVLGIGFGTLTVSQIPTQTGFYPNLVGIVVGAGQLRLAIIDNIPSPSQQIITNSLGSTPTYQTAVGIAGGVIPVGAVVATDINGNYQLTNALDSGLAIPAGVAISAANAPGASITVATKGDLVSVIGIAPGVPCVVSATVDGGIVASYAASGGWYPGLVGMLVFGGIFRLACTPHNGETS